MHTVSFYTIRVRVSRNSEKYQTLGELNTTGLDMYSILKNYINKYAKDTIEDKKKNKALYFDECSEICFDDKKELIYGYAKVGKYGETFNVVDRSSKEPMYDGKTNDIFYNQRYIMAFLPGDLREGYIAVHTVHQTNVKGILFDHLKAFCLANYGLTVKINSLLPKEVPYDVLNGKVSEIRAINHSPTQDVCDELDKGCYDVQTEFVIKGRRNALGRLRDYVTPQGKQKPTPLIEVLDQKSSEIKLFVDVNGRKRLYKCDNILGKGITFILDEKDMSISQTTGIPCKERMKQLLREHLNIVLKEIYGKEDMTA